MKLLLFAVVTLIATLGSADAREPAPVVARSDLRRFAAEMRLGYISSEQPYSAATEDTLMYPPVLSTSFDSLWILPSEPYRTHDHMKAWLEATRYRAIPKNVELGIFVVVVQDSTPQIVDLGTGQSLTMLANVFGFERISHVIAVWHANGDSLRFEGVLNRGIAVGIGGATFDRAVPLADQTYLLMGHTGGGDGGGVWGSVWFAHWKRPFELRFLYEKRWDKPDSFDGLEVAMDSALDDSTLVAIVTVRQRGKGRARYTEGSSRWGSMVDADSTLSGRADWTIADSDTVRLANLIRSR